MTWITQIYLTVLQTHKQLGFHWVKVNISVGMPPFLEALGNDHFLTFPSIPQAIQMVHPLLHLQSNNDRSFYVETLSSSILLLSWTTVECPLLRTHAIRLDPPITQVRVHLSRPAKLSQLQRTIHYAMLIRSWD